MCHKVNTIVYNKVTSTQSKFTSVVSTKVTPTQIKNLTNFLLDDFEDLCHDVCITIATHVKIMGELQSVGR